MLDAYNTLLDRRYLRRKFVIDRGFLDFRKVTWSFASTLWLFRTKKADVVIVEQIQIQEKKRSKEEKDLLQRVRVYAKMQTAEDFDQLVDGLTGTLLIYSMTPRVPCSYFDNHISGSSSA